MGVLIRTVVAPSIATATVTNQSQVTGPQICAAHAPVNMKAAPSTAIANATNPADDNVFEA